jgi:hypothetical protein
MADHPHTIDRDVVSGKLKLPLSQKDMLPYIVGR